MKVIAHNKPLLLIGADILCGGRAGWSYRSLGVGLSGKGVVTFANGRRTVALPLVNTPVYGQPHFASLAMKQTATSDLVAWVCTREWTLAQRRGRRL